MNELDLLKTHWQKDNEYIKFKKNDIINMIHKSSSSIVKWIFTICCLEFALGIALSFINDDNEVESRLFKTITLSYDIVFYAIILYFIYQFYTLSRKITSINDTKTLLQTIINVRKNADKYIKFNLLALTVAFFIGCFFVLLEKYNENQSWGEQLFYGLAFVIIMLLAWLLFQKIIKLYYKLLYGFLLKKLDKNYNELIALER